MNPKDLLDFSFAAKKDIDMAEVNRIESNGYAHLVEEYENEYGQEIEIAVYECDGKTYLIRYVYKECVIFRDITPLNR